MVNNDISFLFVTNNRPLAAKRLIDSVRQRYPAMPIYVGDQSKPTPAMQAFYEDRAVHARYFPFDSGVSYCRTELVKEITTDYVLFGDDDFVFTEHSQFDVSRQILQENQHIGLVGGSLVETRDMPDGRCIQSFRRFEKKIYLDEESRLLLSIPIDHLPPEIGQSGDQKFYYCDMTLDWALCRRDLFSDPRVLWDPQFKSNGEHENFFLQLKKYSPYRVAYYPGMQCSHQPLGDANSEHQRERQEGWRRFGAKWNVTAHLELGVGLHYFDDYEKPEPYNFHFCPEYVSAKPAAHQASYLQSWPEGYLEAAEVSGCSTLMETRAELQAIYSSRSWRMAMFARRTAQRMRQIVVIKQLGRAALQAFRKMRRAYRSIKLLCKPSPQSGG